MTPIQTVDVPLSAIVIHEHRARTYNPDAAHLLAASIARQGLIHPILIRPLGGGRYRLIAGLHRLKAHEINAADTIRSTVTDTISDEEALMYEVMENLGRARLTALDRCHHVHDLKHVWETLHPETKKGGDKNVKKNKGKTKGQNLPFGEIRADEMPVFFGFAREFGDKIGLGQRAIKLCVYIWTKLAPAVRVRLEGTALADKQTELKALADLLPAQQVQVLDVILDPAVVADNVAEALAHLAGHQAQSREVRLLMSVQKGFGNLPEELADQFVVTHSAAILASLKRQGHI